MMTAATPPEAAPNTPEVALASGIPPEELDRLTDDIIAALKTVYDPEIPADIYELGLIYRVDIDDNRNVTIDMRRGAGRPRYVVRPPRDAPR